MDAHDERHRSAVVNMISAYTLIMKVLALTPIPIGIAPIMETPYTDEVYEALIRANEVLRDVPMDAEARQYISEIILDWVIGSEWLLSDEEDPAPWKLDIVRLQVQRIKATADIVVAMLYSKE